MHLRDSISVMKHHDQNKLGRKGLFWLTRPHQCSCLKEVSTRAQTSQEPGGKR